MNNIKIGVKLIGGFIIVALIAAFIGWFGIQKMGQITKADTVLYERMTIPITLMSDVSTYFQRVRINSRDIIRSNDPKEISEIKTTINELSAKITEKMGAFEKLILSEEMKKAYNEFSTKRDDFRGNLNEIIKLAEANKDVEAYSILDGEGKTSAMAEQAAIDNLIEMKTNDAKETADINVKTASSSNMLMLGILVSGIIIALLLGIFLTISITRPINTVVQAARKIAEEDLANLTDVLNAASIGDFSRLAEIKTQELTIKSNDEIGILSNTFNQMIAKFKMSGKAVEQFMNAVKTVAFDANMLSKAAVEGKLATRADASKHQGDFRKIVQGVNDTLDAVIGPLNVAGEYVDRISKGDIPQKITDSYNGDFNEIKNNLNQCIEAVNALVADANMLSKAAVEGKLATRADASKHQGDFRKIVQGVDDCLDAVIGPLNVAAEYVDRISKGDVPKKITDNYNGDFNEIKNNLNQCIEAIENQADAAEHIGTGDFSVKVNVRSENDKISKGLVNVVSVLQGLQKELNRLTIASRDGMLSERGKPEQFKGAYAEVITGVNAMLDAILLPIGEGNRILAQVSVGKIDELITQTYKGDHESMKQAINNVATVLQGLQKELNRLTIASRDGMLSERGKPEQFKGAYAEVITGVNSMLDAILIPIGEGNKVLRLIRGGNLREKVTIDCKGDHQAMKEAVNGVHAWLSALIDYVTKIARGDLANAKMDKASNDDQIHEFLMLMKSNINALVADADMLAQAGINGQLATRANVEKHNGDFRKIVEGFNGTLDSVVTPINEAQSVLEKVAARDLTVRVNGDYKGDMAKIKTAINSAVDNLDKALQQVTEATEQVTSAGGQISSGSQSLAQGANEQASSLEEVSSSLEEMASMTKQNADNANQAKGLSAESDGHAKTGTEAMGRMSGAINRIKESSDQTAKIVKTIDEIAMQTNLLALNAAVEAARAGEAGRGFAVVAEEVRNLAQRSAQAAKSTADMISESVKNADDGVKIATEVSQSFGTIASSAKKVNDLIAEIAAASQEQSSGIEQINTAVAQMDKVTQQNAANSEESASAAEELSSQAEELKNMISQFALSQSMMSSSTPRKVAAASHTVVHAPVKEKSNYKAIGKKPSGKTTSIRPEDIIPLDDEALKEF